MITQTEPANVSDGRCEKEFGIPPDYHETFFGLIPLHTRLAKQLLNRIRPLVEAENKQAPHPHGQDFNTRAQKDA